MSKIQKLSPQEAQKIAAGEVVERPANIVKELLENALDAQATHISLYIENGGKDSIQVVDNGEGMDAIDAKACFEYHATSKIKTVDDLFDIATFGFRGEALSSISSISHVTLITKQKDALEGIQLTLEGNCITSEKSVPANTGTDITIEHIFYNVPARKKFLKTKETEWRQIQHLFSAVALHHIHVHFKLYSEKKLLLNCPPTQTALERWQQLNPADLQEHMIPLINISHHKGISVDGIISNQQYGQYDRSQIYFFVNKRWVKNYILSRALIDGYKNILPINQYPTGCINITIDPAQIDVNIHPRKEEVQFLHPNIVRDIIKNAASHTINESIKKQLNPLSAQQQVPITKSVDSAHIAHYNQINTISYETSDKSNRFVPFNFDHFFDQPLSSLSSVTSHKTEPPISSPTDSPRKHDIQQPVPQISEHIQATTVSEDMSHTIIGIFNKTYILVEKEECILFVDQHAAHERILFEQLSTAKNAMTVQLLFPHIITLNAKDCILLAPLFTIFQENGIEIDLFSETQLVIKSIPIQLKNSPIEQIIRAAIAWLHQEKDYAPETLTEQFTKMLHADIACKAAVKAGDTLSQEEAQKLLRDLQKTDNKSTCPHGRPTTWELSLDFIKKKFKRDYR